MKPVHIDKNGNVSDGTPEGERAWLGEYDKKKAEGATEEEARTAADRLKDKMDNVCSNGRITE
jgi:hypothetical protein